jgi:hypothetical protein
VPSSSWTLPACSVSTFVQELHRSTAAVQESCSTLLSSMSTICSTFAVQEEFSQSLIAVCTHRLTFVVNFSGIE